MASHFRCVQGKVTVINFHNEVRTNTSEDKRAVKGLFMVAIKYGNVLGNNNF